MGKKYNIIYADPPWSYRNKNTGGTMASGADAKYKTMTTDDICEIPIESIRAKDSVLFLWATCPLKQEAFKVMDAWGYKYKTTIYWRKYQSFGMGFWFRGQVEELLLGVRGNVKAFRLQHPNFLQLKALSHSEKPEEFRELIEVATANMPEQERIELFARKKVPHWDAWGNEVESDIKMEVISEQ